MGRLTDFFKRMGRGIKRGLQFVGEKILPVARNVVNVAKTPLARGLISQIPVVGPTIAANIDNVDRGLGVAEKIRDRYLRPAPAPPPAAQRGPG
jgi:hypothetical protein